MGIFVKVVTIHLVVLPAPVEGGVVHRARIVNLHVVLDALPERKPRAGRQARARRGERVLVVGHAHRRRARDAERRRGEVVVVARLRAPSERPPWRRWLGDDRGQCARRRR